MKKEDSVKIIEKEIARWERMKEVVNGFEKGKIYKIIFQYEELTHRDPMNWKNHVWTRRESVFIGTLKEYNKASINFEILTVRDVDGSEFRYKISSEDRRLDYYRKQMKVIDDRYALPGSTKMTDQDKKDKKRLAKNLNKKFHCSVKLDDFIKWEEWDNDLTQAPLMVNYQYVSEKMRKLLFGV